MKNHISLQEKKKELLMRGDFDALLSLVESEIKENPKSLEARRSMASLIYSKPDRLIEGALLAAAVVSESGTKEIADLYLLATYLIDLGYADFAVDFLLLGIEAKSSDNYDEYISSVKLSLCMAYLYTGRYNESLLIVDSLPEDMVYFSDEGPWSIDAIKTAISDWPKTNQKIEFDSSEAVDDFLLWFTQNKESLAVKESSKHIKEALNIELKKVLPEMTCEVQCNQNNSLNLVSLKGLPETVAEVCTIIAKTPPCQNWVFVAKA